jgi:hypothetical protein
MQMSRNALDRSVQPLDGRLKGGHKSHGGGVALWRDGRRSS